MQLLNSAPGRTALVEGKEHLFFSGYSYLGMSAVDDFIKLIKEGIDRFGLLHPSSRISNTQLQVYEELELKLSTLINQEDTVTFSSGFLAGRAVIDVLSTTGFTFYSLPGTHPAIATNSIVLKNDWQQELLQHLTASTTSASVLLIDSVNPLTATINDFTFLKNVPTDKKLICVVDDSHGIGLLANGEGISAALPHYPNVEYIISYSLSKAFHINGGAVSCCK